MSWNLTDFSQNKEIKSTYAKTLENLIQEDSNVVVGDADLVGSAGTSELYKKYPDNCVDFGICEQNMIAASAAMSQVGMIPYVHSFAPFVSRRVFDQIYVSAGFAKNNLHIFASEPGFWSQYNGATHTTFEDIGIMKTVPGATIVCPSDATTFSWIMRYYHDHGGLFYNRSTRRSVPQIYTDDSEFEYGKSMLIKKGEDAVIFAEGTLVYDAILAARELKKNGIDSAVVDLLFIKPLDIELILKLSKNVKAVVTVENHNVCGGIGESIARTLMENDINVRFKAIGICDRYGQVGTKDYLKEVYGLTTDAIKKTVEKLIQ